MRRCFDSLSGRSVEFRKFNHVTSATRSSGPVPDGPASPGYPIFRDLALPELVSGAGMQRPHYSHTVVRHRLELEDDMGPAVAGNRVVRVHDPTTADPRKIGAMKTATSPEWGMNRPQCAPTNLMTMLIWRAWVTNTGTIRASCRQEHPRSESSAQRTRECR